jgi:hypothetical protein
LDACLNLALARAGITQIAAFAGALARHPVAISQRFPLIPMKSHVIPILTKMKRTTKQGQLKTSNRRQKTAGFIQATFHQTRDPARGRADISPKVARAAGRPAMGQTADPAVAAAGSAEFFLTPPTT